MNLQFLNVHKKVNKRSNKRIYADKIGDDVVAQQVKDLLQKADQKLILMVRQ